MSILPAPTPYALGAPIPIARMARRFMLVDIGLGWHNRTSLHSFRKLSLPFCFCPSLWLPTLCIWRTLCNTIVNVIVRKQFDFRSYRDIRSALPLLYLPGP